MRSPRSYGTNDEDLKRKVSWASVKRLLMMAAPYKRLLIFSAVLALFGAALQLALPLTARIAINALAQTNSTQLLDRYALLAVGLLIGSSLLFYVQSITSAYAGNHIIKDLRLQLFSHLQRLPVAYFDRTRSGDLTSHLSNDVSQLQATLADDIARLAANVILFVGLLGLAVFMNWRMTLVVVGILFAAMLFFVISGRGLRKINRVTLDALGHAMGGMTEALANIRLVKAFARESHEDSRAGQGLDTVFHMSMRGSRVEAMMGSVGTAGGFMMLVGVLWVGYRGVLSHTFQPGDLGGFLIAVFFLMQPMATLTALYTRLQRAIGASDRIFAILDQGVEEPDVEDAVEFPRGEGLVRFEDVRFRYVDDTPVLHGLSVTLLPGKVTALVGPSGAGKSTLAALLYRFYEPQSGYILIDGVPVRGIKRTSLRENIGIVPQDPILFNGTILENIRYGRLDATDEEVIGAARDANVHEFAQSFPDAYNTMIGERGVTLSGGQRQRVAIARAVLKNPKILVLDEATSALDNRSESLVREALDRLMTGRTTLVIAHRLTTIQSADQIAVIQDGRIVETGKHSDLLRTGGLYSELYDLVEA